MPIHDMTEADILAAVREWRRQNSFAGEFMATDRELWEWREHITQRRSLEQFVENWTPAQTEASLKERLAAVEQRIREGCRPQPILSLDPPMPRQLAFFTPTQRIEYTSFRPIIPKPTPEPIWPYVRWFGTFLALHYLGAVDAGTKVVTAFETLMQSGETADAVLAEMAEEGDGE